MKSSFREICLNVKIAFSSVTKTAQTFGSSIIFSAVLLQY